MLAIDLEVMVNKIWSDSSFEAFMFRRSSPACARTSKHAGTMHIVYIPTVDDHFLLCSLELCSRDCDTQMQLNLVAC